MPDSAVNIDLQAVPHSVHHFGEHIDGPFGTIQSVTTMIGNNQAFYTILGA